MTDDLIDRARKALEGTTEGPWSVEYEDGDVYVYSDGSPGFLVARAVPIPSGEHDANARFIAAARSLVPDLIARVEELEDAISGRTFSVDEGREWKARAEAAEKALHTARAEALIDKERTE